MPEWDDSTWKAGGVGRRLAARQAAWVVAAVGLLPLAAHGQQTPDPAVARLLRELRAWEDEPLMVGRALARAGDPAAARETLQRAVTHAKDARGLLAIEKVQAELGYRDAALRTLLLARNSDLVAPLGAALGVNGRVPPPDPDFDARLGKRLTSETLTDIAIEQFRLGDRTAAETTFEEALRSARSLVPNDRSGAIARVVALRATAGDLDAALKDVASLADGAERCNALTQIDVGDRDVDVKTLDRILGMIDAEAVRPEFAQGFDHWKPRLTDMRIATLVAMAWAQVAANDRAEAGKTLQGARRAAEVLEKEDARYKWLWHIARALVKTGNAAEASRIAGAIGRTERNWKLDVLTVIAEAHAEIGDPANRKAWDDALGAAETPFEKVRLLLEIAQAQTNAGDRAAALRTSEQALAAVRSMNEEELEYIRAVFVKNRIAEIRAEAGDVVGAIRLANEIEDIEVQGAALAVIAAVQAASGDVNGALGTAATIRPLDPTQRNNTHLPDQFLALREIIKAQARAGDVAGALATSDRRGSSREARRWGLIYTAEGLGQRNAASKRAQPPREP